MNREILIDRLDSIAQLAIMARSFVQRNINKGFEDIDAAADYILDIEEDLRVAQIEINKYYMEQE